MAILASPVLIELGALITGSSPTLNLSSWATFVLRALPTKVGCAPSVAVLGAAILAYAQANDVTVVVPLAAGFHLQVHHDQLAQRGGRRAVDFSLGRLNCTSPDVLRRAAEAFAAAIPEQARKA
jgi:hypothetical protein